MFVAALALSVACEIVIFSPARRASRKLLERVVEFIRVLGQEKRITECELPTLSQTIRFGDEGGKRTILYVDIHSHMDVYR